MKLLVEEMSNHFPRVYRLWIGMEMEMEIKKLERKSMLHDQV